MAIPKTPKEVIAEQVRQLMDEGGQRARLAHLSTSAAVGKFSKERVNGVEQGTSIGRVWPKAGSSTSMSTYGGSGTESPPCGGSDSGREPPYSADSAESSESEGQTKCPAKPRPPPGAKHRAPPGLHMHPSEGTFAPEPSLSATESDVIAASQYLQECEVECLQVETFWLQQKLASAVSQHSNQQALQAVKLMAQQIEQMSQTINIMQAQQLRLQQQNQTFTQQQNQTFTPLNAEANCFVPGAAVVDDAGMWHPAPFDLQPSPAMPGSFEEQSAFPAAAMQPPGTFVTPWDQQVAMPGSSGPPGAHYPKEFVPPNGRGQGTNQCYGTMPTRKGAAGQGLNGKACGKEPALSHEPLHELWTQPEKVVLAKRINRLGFESAKALEAHYSQFGTVERVLVPHLYRSRAERWRPSGLGFIVMSKKEEVDAILAMGPDQLVPGGRGNTGVTIKVQRCQRRTDYAEDADYMDWGVDQ